MKIPDAAIIANLMMGGNGEVTTTKLTEIEISAVQEAMNQMIGSAATSMATMFAREVNISPPNSRTWNTMSEPIADDLRDEENIISVCFNLTIGDLVDSNIMQILPIETGKRIISIMMGQDNEGDSQSSLNENEPMATIEDTYVEPKPIVNEPVSTYEEPLKAETPRQPVEVHNVKFESLEQNTNVSGYSNIDLIMDVPLEVSVLLGRTKKSIKDILNLRVGSLIELDKLADEPVEILVNGKMIAYGEVVVVDENFGVRITSIVSGKERLNSLK